MKAIIVCVDTWKALILIKFSFNLSIFITYEESIVFRITINYMNLFILLDQLTIHCIN